MNGIKSNNYNLHFTSPIPLQKISKDVIIILNKFQDEESVLKTIHESCSIFDRIWIFNIDGEVSFINIIKLVYQRDYLSLQATLNNFQQLSKYFQLQNYSVNYVDFKIIVKIIKNISISSKEQQYNIQYDYKNQKEQEMMKQEAVIYIFGQQNFINTNFNLEKYNAHVFFIYIQKSDISQNTVVSMNNVILIEYVSQSYFIDVSLFKIVQILNCLYVSTRDEIGSVNNSILISRPIYQDDQYIGMLLINEQLFGSFADMTLNNLDGLTATTLKVRMMDKQIQILNPYYQFSQTVSYQQEVPQPLIQTIPGILNNYPQNQFSDIVSAKIITIPKTINASTGSFIESINEYYNMQVVRNELTIHIGLSSTVITTQSRHDYSNVNYCVPPKQIQFTVQPLNLQQLRYNTHLPFYTTNTDCLVSDGYSCMFKTDVDLYRQAKEQILKQNSSNIQYLCGYNYTSTKFTLHTDSDDFLLYLQTVPEFGDITTLVKDHNDLKTATLYLNYINQYKVILKYNKVMTTYQYQKSMLDQNGCVMVVQNNTFIPSSNFASLRGLNTSSLSLLYLLYQQTREISHFARYVPKLEYLLDNPLVEAVYLGHSWVSNQDRNYADLLEQKTFVENETGTNDDQKVVNNVCIKIGRLFNNQYFVFSTNPQNNDIVKNEHLKSNIDGTNLKFRLSVVNGQTFLTKPLISKNKSLLGIPRVGGYLTLQLNIKNVFYNITGKNDDFLVMDATGSTLYHKYNDNTDQYAFGVKQILIKYGYLVETLSNSTVQSVHRSCTRNHQFWETAYQRSANNEFSVVVSHDISKKFDFLKEADYNQSAVYERSIIFKAESQFFLGGYITIKEFSVLNEFVVLLNDIQLSETSKSSWEKQQYENLTHYLKNIPHNLTALDWIYPNLTRRGQIPQKIVRFEFKHDHKFPVSNLMFVSIMVSQCLFIMILYLKSVTKRTYKLQHQSVLEFNENNIENSINITLYYNSSFDSLTQKQDEILNHTFESLIKYVDRVKQQLLLQKVNLIFEEKNISVADCLKIIQLFEDQHQANIFRYIQIQSVQYYYRSFTVLVPQKIYSDYLINLINRTSWIPNEIARFNSHLKLIKGTYLLYVPSKRYVSINNKNVSKLVTRLQTAIQSTIQSRVPSKPISRQEFTEEIQNLPFWFYNNTISRNNPNPCKVMQFLPMFPNKNYLQSQSLEHILWCSILD
ncbi:Conserved_hypothetical protein [Hexamita inflata]|uniref:Transmembrane protein n=1 Tax=Hexamita inflata TaxID=28002 RepID=A0AA86PEW8_9EUKA|nr:Conserved hypothetical protein [Hexamita inflata]